MTANERSSARTGRGSSRHACPCLRRAGACVRRGGGCIPWAAWGALLILAALPSWAASVLMISVDGMKPEYVTAADERGLKVPFLRSLMAGGAYATGVTGVWPTVTYPSHTTLVTGVTPAEHGILNNLEFDPRRKFADSWFWYARQVKVPTLWHAARQAHLRTASIAWPVTVGDTDIDFLIPEYWRIFRPTEDLNPTDRLLIEALSRPEGLIADMQRTQGPYLMGNDVSLAADEIKTRYALEVLRAHKPAFMTLHLSSLDEEQHDHGPFSAEANADIEAIDGMISRLVAASRANDPAAVAVVVSDHGFESLEHRLNLYIPFIRAGLIEMSRDEAGRAAVVSWSAQPWLAGGMAAVMLRDPTDERTASRVRELLERLAADPASGVAQVLDHEATLRRGAFPDARFLVVMQPGYATGNAIDGDVVTDFKGHGGHGFTPESPEMRASLFIAGSGIARHRDLGLIDMRQIAPTIASLLGVPLPSASARPLAVRQ